MIEEYTARLLNTLEPTISKMPPQLYVGTLVGIINTCLFYLGFGRSFRMFIPYLLVGTGAAAVGLTVGSQLPANSGPTIGDVNLLTTTLFTWVTLFIARSLRV